MSNQPLLYLEDLSFGYDAPNIVTNINLSLPSNTRAAIVGQNGVGKSSLLKTIMGLTPCVEGNIFFENQNITGLDTCEIANKGIAFVKQENAVFADLTVMEHFQVLDKNFKKYQINQKLEYFPHLLEHCQTLAKNLSGGQKQQLAIALALATSPKLLLLDEPSANIQPSIIEDMISALLTISKNSGMSLLVAEQNLIVIKNLTDRRYLIEGGTLIRKKVNEIGNK